MILPINGINLYPQNNMSKSAQSIYHTKPMKSDTVSFGNITNDVTKKVIRTAGEIMNEPTNQEHNQAISIMQELFQKISTENYPKFKTSVENLKAILMEHTLLLNKVASKEPQSFGRNGQEIEIRKLDDVISIDLFAPEKDNDYLLVGSEELIKSINIMPNINGVNVASVTAKNPFNADDRWCHTILY